jgi:D-3-phosphoglycerate dehydrogenase
LKEPIVCTEAQFAIGEQTFRRYGPDYQWISCPEEEEILARCIHDHRCRIVVLGTYKYRDRLYRALKESAGQGASLIARHGVGFDGVDLEICRKLGILVTITPGTLDQSVAEHTIALMLSLVRNIPSLDRDMKESRFTPVTTVEVSGKVLGVAGFGKIGKQVARIASCGLGMKVLAFDKVPMSGQLRAEGLEKQAFYDKYGLLDYLTDYGRFAGRPDILSIHMPAAAETMNFFNSERLALLKPSTYLINTGRGALIDEGALYTALEAGKLRAAALDVFHSEPYTPPYPAADLRRLPNIVLTPHVASNTLEANLRVQQSILKNIESFIQGKYTDMNRIA